MWNGQSTNDNVFAPHSSADSTSVARRPTLGDRGFPVAADAWNTLPPAVRAVASPTSFRWKLKVHF